MGHGKILSLYLMNGKVSFLLGPTCTMPFGPPVIFQAKPPLLQIYNMFPTLRPTAYLASEMKHLFFLFNAHPFICALGLVPCFF